ncbi:hypothetical protein CC79DRAFT_1364406 [Sarocladium strictum]
MGFVPRARLLVPLLISAGLVSASPFPRDSLHDAGYSYLMMRDCDSYCGADNQICCGHGQTCTTLDNNIATCLGGGGGFVGGYTTTWTETRTFTSTIQTYWAPAPEPTEGTECIPQAPEQEPCGTVCCAGWQSCAYEGQCASKPGYDEPSTIIVTTDGKVTTRYSAPYRITGTTVVTTTEVAATNTATETETTTNSGDAAEATQTDENGEPIENDGDEGTGGGGLSPGAIAGIVIGVLAGIMLLCLLAFCCIVRGCWALIFGRKKDKEKETREVYEESYYRGSRPPPATRNSGWFGFGRGDRPKSPRRDEKKDTSGKWWLGLAGAAATMLALLNLRKDKKKPARKSGSRSRYSDNSSYFYSDTSPSSASSGRRTHRSRRTRRSDGSRSHSGYTRRPSSRMPSRGPSRAPSRM